MRQPVPFGKYLLLDRISVGGMAEVFKAKSYGVEGFEKIIAIKRILPSMGEDKDFIRMFIDEAKIAGQLSHPNIGQIFELGRAQEAHYIAMEYIWGKDLLQIQNRCRKRGEVMPIEMACFIVAKTAEGLDYAHKKRDAMGTPLEIVHRDCSPQNVLVSYEGEVKIIDFGIARAASRSSRTNAGVLKGKFGYMSPEQVRGLPLDHRSDIFALGTVLYECLTGNRLFHGESDFSTLEKVRNADVRRVRQLRDDVPPEIETVVMRALARDPRQRYQWCSELHADLLAYLTSQSTVFTAKNLGEWLRHWFADDLEREQRQLEAFRLLGRDGLIAGAPLTAARADVLVTLGAPGAPEGDPTILSPPTYDESAPYETIEQRDLETVLDVRGAADGAPDGQDEVDTPADCPGRGGPPALYAPPFALPGQDDPEATIAVPPGRPWLTPEPGRRPTPGPGDLRAADAASPPRHGPTGTFAIAPRGRGRFGLGREVFIAIGFAAMVLAGVVSARSLFFSDRRDRAADPIGGTGTIAVVLGDELPASVALDGRKVGVTQDREPLTLQALVPRTYTLTVSRPGAPPCERAVKVLARKVEVVRCSLSPAAPGRLVLHGLGDGQVVFVDDQEISAQAAHEPIQMIPGGRHVVVVSEGGVQVERFDVELEAGQAIEHAVARRVADPALGAGHSGSGTSRRPATAADTPRPRSFPAAAPDAGPRGAAEPDVPPATPASAVAGQGEAGQSPAGVGYFTAFTQPFARVFIDGKDTGKMTPIAPRSAIELLPGRHHVTFVVDRQRYTFDVDVAAGKTRNLVKDLSALSPGP